MTSHSRPHCELPDACRAKGAGYCRNCSSRAMTKDGPTRSGREMSQVSSKIMRAVWADPRRRAALLESRRAAKLRKSGGDHGVPV